jgi:hypothetical protein
MFILLYTISKNGYSIKSSSLINTRVNGYAFINSYFIKKVSKKLPNIKLEPLPTPYSVRGFDSK